MDAKGHDWAWSDGTMHHPLDVRADWSGRLSFSPVNNSSFRLVRERPWPVWADSPPPGLGGPCASRQNSGTGRLWGRRKPGDQQHLKMAWTNV